MRKSGWVGFASVYLARCGKDSKTIDQNVYAKLDARLGTKASEQLYGCLHHIIKVRSENLNEIYEKI